MLLLVVLHVLQRSLTIVRTVRSVRYCLSPDPCPYCPLLPVDCEPTLITPSQSVDTAENEILMTTTGGVAEEEEEEGAGIEDSIRIISIATRIHIRYASVYKCSVTGISVL